MRFRPKFITGLPIYQPGFTSVECFCNCTMLVDHFLGPARACAMHDGQLFGAG